MSAETQQLLPPGLVVLERGWLSSNNVVIRGRDGVAVVDSGYGSHGAQTVELIARTAGDLPVRTLVNTHLHSDHCGGNAALQARWPAARTLIPPGQAEAVARWDEVALTYATTGQHCPRFRFDATLQPGSSVSLGDRQWEVHAAPGHDPHSVILFEPGTRALISADALWQNGFGIVFPELEGECGFAEVAATLDLIGRLQPLVVVPGHGPVFTDVGAALQRARSRLEAYVASPTRHATHAAKVLLKFKILEVQSAPLDEFMAWAEGTAYFDILRRRWFAGESAGQWLLSLLQELARSGALRLEPGMVVNA